MVVMGVGVRRLADCVRSSLRRFRLIAASLASRLAFPRSSLVRRLRGGSFLRSPPFLSLGTPLRRLFAHLPFRHPPLSPPLAPPSRVVPPGPSLRFAQLAASPVLAAEGILIRLIRLP
jgi:hypothetical protein